MHFFVFLFSFLPFLFFYNIIKKTSTNKHFLLCFFFFCFFFFFFVSSFFFFFLFFFTSPIQIIIFKNKSKTTSNNPDLQNSPQNSRNCKGTLLHRNWRQEQPAAPVPTRHRHWRRVRRESSRPKLASSPSLPFCNGDLQNQTKTQHRQSIVVVFFFVLFFKIGSRVLPVFSNLSRFPASSVDRSSSSFFGGRSAVEDPASWVRSCCWRRSCQG